MNCSTATQKFEALQQLREELGETILAYRESKAKGETEKAEELKQIARNLKTKLETGIKEMNREMLTFIVSDAINPYREGLEEAGLSRNHAECKETKEMTVDIDGIVEESIKHYRENDLSEWAVDIEENEELLIDILLDPKEKNKIEKRIKAGMIPIVMPGRDTQQRSWRKSLENLKPVWIKNGTEKTLDPTSIYSYGLYALKMEPFPAQASDGESFFDSLPDRPYLVWTKPTRKVDSRTCDLTFQEQKKLLELSHTHNLDLIDKTSIVPTEYAALQLFITSRIRKQAQDHFKYPILDVTPLDDWMSKSSCRFLAADLFLNGYAPYACFDTVMYFDGDDAGRHPQRGFRTVARS